jgi:SH3-like domain-containing protein
MQQIPSPLQTETGMATAPTAWLPTHEVKGRAQAWERPDPNSAVTGTIERRLPVQLLERHGEWAHVVCSNGWSAWIDGRLLKAR